MKKPGITENFNVKAAKPVQGKLHTIGGYHETVEAAKVMECVKSCYEGLTNLGQTPENTSHPGPGVAS